MSEIGRMWITPETRGGGSFSYGSDARPSRPFAKPMPSGRTGGGLPDLGVVFSDDKSAATGPMARLSFLETSRVAEALVHAAERGANTEDILSSVEQALDTSPSDKRTLSTDLELKRGRIEALLRHLGECEVIDQGKAKGLADTVERLPGVTVAARDGLTHAHWDETGDAQADSTEGWDRGRILLVAVRAAQVGDGNHQTVVVTHEVRDPTIDLAGLMDDTEVAAALGALSAAPDDPVLRAAAVTALTGQADAGDAWTEAYAVPSDVRFGIGSATLDGTVSIIRCRDVQEGDHQYMESHLVHSAGPDVAIQTLLRDRDVVQSLIDAAVKPDDGGAARRFREATEGALCADLAASTVARAGYATAYQSPAPGRTLEVNGGIGVSVGRRSTVKGVFLQRAHAGTRLRTRTTTLATMAQRAARKPSGAGSPDVC